MKKLFTLLVLLVAIVTGAQAAVTTTHTPGKYESSTGYNTELTTYESNKYEVYYVSWKSSKAYIAAGKSYVTDANAYCLISNVANNTTDGIDFSDGWGSIISGAFSGSNSSPAGEWAVSATNNSTHYVPLTSSASITLKISGYDQFSFAGRDGNKNAGSGQFIVTIDGVAQEMTHTTTDWSFYRFNITTGAHTIVITGDNASTGARFRGFSLRLPSVVTPSFSLTKDEIDTDESSQIIVGNNEGLDGLTMNDLSYDSEVIEIDANGAITPKAPGSTTITFTTAAVEGKYNAGTASLPITVTAAKTGTQLSFTNPTATVELNGTVQNVATLTGGPEGATITYASSDETVATVAADGTVTGKKIGEKATITASYAGNDEYKASEASYVISVVAPALVAVDNKVWNGNDWIEDIASGKTRDITTTEWIDNLEVVGTSENKFTLKNNKSAQTTPDFANGFNVRLTTNGVSTADARYVHFIVKPNTKITVYAIRTGPDGGAFALATGSIDNEVASHEFDGGGIETIDYIYTGSENTDVYVYATANGAQFVAFRVAPLVEVTISDAGAASFSSTQAIDFAGSKVTAYQATAKSESYVHLEEITKLPAGAGAIIKAPAGPYKVAVANCVTPALTDNLLVGTGENTFKVTSAEYEKVFKYVKTNDGVVGFQKAKVDWICQAGHAYLMLPETSAREFIGIFGEEVVTGIDAIENGTIDNDAPAYNLAGQKVGKGYKGIVIINGKKVVK